MTMKRYIAAAFIALIYLSTASAQRLVILHTNDTHSQIPTIKVGPRKGLGGVEQRLQLINEVRERYGKDRVLLLDGGDYDQGTPYFTMARGEVEIELMDALGYDVATLGNHEFDNGQEELASRLGRALFKTVTCNYDFSNTPLRDVVKPYVIVRRGGMKIGIIGATAYLETCVAKANQKGLKQLNATVEINRWADYLKNRRHCDLVILLSHLGYALENRTEESPDDRYIAAHSRNLDLIIGGHTHTMLKSAKEVADLDGRMIPIMQVGSQGCAVGKLEIF